MKSSKKQEKFDITQFEKLNNENGELNGGYSTLRMGGYIQIDILKILKDAGIDIDVNTNNPSNNASCSMVNNCHSGNCVSQCGEIVD